MDKKTIRRKGAANKSVSAKPARKNKTAELDVYTDEVELDMPRLLSMIQALMAHLESGDLKGRASVNDLVRLLQLYKELSEEQIKEVEVRWVDQAEPDGEAVE